MRLEVWPRDKASVWAGEWFAADIELLVEANEHLLVASIQLQCFLSINTELIEHSDSLTELAQLAPAILAVDKPKGRLHRK